ncbi:MAG TPA: HD domain-containing protein [Candidatus Saccharimonadales bacterium]|nr:HD domain-containing protein [Candidatus Saccharimonadales bacterium]
MTGAELIKRTRKYAEDTLRKETNAHDWWHVARVEKLALHLARQEKGANLLVVQLGALLHDIADWKFHNGDTEIGPRTAQQWLEGLGTDPEVTEQVAYIVRHVSFRGGTNQHAMESLEGKIVQDADRLDAIGAIGIARVFTFGGAFGRQMYDPAHKPQQFTSFEAYKNQVKDNTSINHFYEKLLLLKDRLNTDAARRFAAKRHEFMEQFLDEFYAEWEGER